MYLIPWFKCACGKIHTADYVSSSTVCKCGRKLLDQIPFRPLTPIDPKDW